MLDERRLDELVVSAHMRAEDVFEKFSAKFYGARNGKNQSQIRGQLGEPGEQLPWNPEQESANQGT